MEWETTNKIEKAKERFIKTMTIVGELAVSEEHLRELTSSITESYVNEIELLTALNKLKKVESTTEIDIPEFMK